MTDKEKLIDMFTEFGIGFTPEKIGASDSITLNEGAKRVGGYSGFYACFYFAKNGNFKKVEIGE